MTVLALIETVVVSSLVLVTAIYLQRPNLVAIPALIAPMLMLRTRFSTTVGLRLWARWHNIMRIISRFQAPAVAGPIQREVRLHTGFVLFIVGLPLFAIGCRLAAALLGVTTHPIRSLRAIPYNWWRVALAMDIAHPPEAVPGIEVLQHEAYPPHRFLRHVRLVLRTTSANYQERPGWWRGGYIGGWSLQLILLYVPAVLYRWSLKSTAIVWAPLVWAVYSGRRRRIRTADRLADILTDPWERFLRWWSGVVFVCGTAIPGWILLRAPTSENPVTRVFVDHWVYSGAIHWWHVTRWTAILLTFVLYRYAFVSSRRLARPHPPSRRTIHCVLSSLIIVRSIAGVLLGMRLLVEIASAANWHFVW